MTFSHSDLVLRAVRWLRSHHKCSVVYAEMTTGAPETPDAIGWKQGFSRLVECKISRNDFFRDQKTKVGAIHPMMGMGGQRWYFVPAGLVTAEEVPAWCGLAYVYPKKVSVIKVADERQVWDSRGEAQMLTSAIRRLELGSKFDATGARWESYLSRIKRQRRAGESR